MKAKKIIPLFLIFLNFGCTSVPKVNRGAYSLDNSKYDVVVDRDYMENPEELKYAINSFVKQRRIMVKNQSHT